MSDADFDAVAWSFDEVSGVQRPRGHRSIEDGLPNPSGEIVRGERPNLG